MLTRVRLELARALFSRARTSTQHASLEIVLGGELPEKLARTSLPYLRAIYARTTRLNFTAVIVRTRTLPMPSPLGPLRSGGNTYLLNSDARAKKSIGSRRSHKGAMCSGTRTGTSWRAGAEVRSSRFLRDFGYLRSDLGRSFCNGREHMDGGSGSLGSRYQDRALLIAAACSQFTTPPLGERFILQRSPAGDGSLTSSATTTCRETRLARHDAAYAHRSTSGVWGR